jgi:hypothetical protein
VYVMMMIDKGWISTSAIDKFVKYRIGCFEGFNDAQMCHEGPFTLVDQDKTVSCGRGGRRRRRRRGLRLAVLVIVVRWLVFLWLLLFLLWWIFVGSSLFTTGSIVQRLMIFVTIDNCKSTLFGMIQEHSSIIVLFVNRRLERHVHEIIDILGVALLVIVPILVYITEILYQ